MTVMTYDDDDWPDHEITYKVIDGEIIMYINDSDMNISTKINRQDSIDLVRFLQNELGIKEEP